MFAFLASVVAGAISFLFTLTFRYAPEVGS
jgi:hypothetical protein